MLVQYSVFVMIFPTYSHSSNEIYSLVNVLQHDHALNHTRSHSLYVAQYVHVKTFIYSGTVRWLFLITNKYHSSFFYGLDIARESKFL